MEEVLILIFIGAIGGAIVIYVRGRERAEDAPAAQPAGSSPVSGNDVRRLKPGDVVHFEGRDFIVEGTVRLDQGGFRWEEHRLVDGQDSLWLSVEDDEGLEIVVWQRRKGVALEPGPAQLEFEGTTYLLDERGQATYQSEGATGMAPQGRLQYADYEAGERRLSFERGEGDTVWEIGVGRVISEAMLDIYPSSGPRA